jgi:hypothetical protein
MASLRVLVHRRNAIGNQEIDTSFSYSKLGISRLATSLFLQRGRNRQVIAALNRLTFKTTHIVLSGEDLSPIFEMQSLNTLASNAITWTPCLAG